jgi:protein TonB
MFTTLLESRAKKQRSLGGTFVSLAAHVALIVIAIQATLNAGQKNETREQKLTFADVKKDEPAPPKPKVQEVLAAPTPKGFQTLTAPVNIPDMLPEIDLSKKPTNESDWLGTGPQGGRGNGVVGAPAAENTIYSEAQVEKPALAAPGSPAPRYPELLKAAGVEGEVVVTFVVDTTGRADPASLRILSTTNELFGAAVRTALPNMRFIPAEVGGKRVKQQVQQPFVFNIIK